MRVYQFRALQLPAAQEHVLAQEEGKARFLQAVSDLSKAFALAVPHDEALAIKDDVGFFQATRSALAKATPSGAKSAEEMERPSATKGWRLERLTCGRPRTSMIATGARTRAESKTVS